ncbi:MAG: FMN-binding protein [Candidatus Kaiserbacteria bacterium]|nr:FMN-binding protein [Candidatus Kaiserbacteria bacterium]
MKKYLTSALFTAAFSVFALVSYRGTTVSDTTPAPVADSSTVSSSPVVTPAPQTQPIAVVTPTPVTPTPTPAPKPQGQYIDGTYTGSAANAYYGYIQVQMTVSGGKIADVQFLQYPNDRRESVSINTHAMPILKTEAIQAQSANVSGVSGASDSSAAFRESLASAIAQAKS